MKSFLKILASILLLFNGFGALYGGWNLIIYPDGSSINLSMDWLKHTPFHNYLIPGIILFIANGLCSILIFQATIFNYRHYKKLIMVQGAILCGWIVIQILLIRTIYFLHIIMGFTGILLLIIGTLLRENKHSARIKGKRHGT